MISQSHRRKPNRLKTYDYSENGWYFVTICTKNREECFGNVENGKIILNESGIIVKQQWLWLTKQYNYVTLDEWIIMPNHIHGILVIHNGSKYHVGTSRDLSLQQWDMIKPLSEIVGAFKTTSSKLIHRLGIQIFQWQRSFYDHIIRNENSLFSIREYIHNNPTKWELDENHPNNIKNHHVKT